MDKQREKLIELIIDAIRSHHFASYRGRAQGKTLDIATHIADHLLADEEIKHAFELLKAEKEGRLIVPPVNVWGKVYRITRNKVKECGVVFVGISADTECSYFNYIEKYEDGAFYKTYSTHFADIGKTVFLSREAAEKALKGVE